MKFKLQFEIVYENIDKDNRNMKIQSVLDDIVTEVVSMLLKVYHIL